MSGSRACNHKGANRISVLSQHACLSKQYVHPFMILLLPLLLLPLLLPFLCCHCRLI